MSEITESIQIEPTDEDIGERIDTFVSSHQSELTRSYIQKLIENGNIGVIGKKSIAKNYRIKKDDILFINIPPVEEIKVIPENIPLNIVYEDDDIIVIDKPKNMVVHPAPGNYTGTLVNALMYHCKSLSGINGVIRPGIVHRIDKDTSGLLVVAKNDSAHQGLSEQFAVHSITRAYNAIVYNNFKNEEGTVDAPIGRNKKDRLKMAVVPLADGKRAITHYKVLERSSGFSFIECRLETGRTHQIRVHMAYIKHPLLGDPLYGPKNGVSNIDTQVLHASLLGFIHPITGNYMEFKSELPDTFIFAMKKTGFIV